MLKVDQHFGGISGLKSKPNKKQALNQSLCLLPAACFILASCLVYCSALKMEVKCLLTLSRLHGILSQKVGLLIWEEA
jgi:hypothetical protein